ncbi:MAG: CARDB domain-containing protein [Candidatus Micrarchaeales archaeon]|jgi:hypothetical protein
MMLNEKYLWVIIAAVILLAAVYFRYFYQPTIGIELSIGGRVEQPLYPYQKVMLLINASNNGSSAISNMSIGVIVNGNLSTLYKVTLPVGKQTTISYNYSPVTTGNFTISAVADPGRLYNLADRSKAIANMNFAVSKADKPNPLDFLPSHNISEIASENLTRGGYLISAYIWNQYNLTRFSLTGSRELNMFLLPILNLTSYYINNITIANAKYSGNAGVYSLWIKGYLSPNIFSVAASAAGLRWSNVTTGIGRVTSVRITNNTTFCSWYSGGWMKTLSYQGNRTCTDLLNETDLQHQPLSGGIGKQLYEKTLIPNASSLGNFSGIGNNITYAARLLLFNNASFIYASVANNTLKNATCFGVISSINNSHYCSSYVFPQSGKIGAFSLIRTTAYVNTYNLTVMSLVNTSAVLTQVPIAVDAIKNFNISGNYLQFKSGITNTCSLGSNFGCENLTYLNGIISFKITNKMNESVGLREISCYTFRSLFATTLSTSLSKGNATNITADCYGVAGKLSGVALGLNLKLLLNYSEANMTHLVNGTAFIPFG